MTVVVWALSTSLAAEGKHVLWLGTNPGPVHPYLSLLLDAIGRLHWGLGVEVLEVRVIVSGCDCAGLLISQGREGEQVLWGSHQHLMRPAEEFWQPPAHVHTFCGVEGCVCGGGS